MSRKSGDFFEPTPERGQFKTGVRPIGPTPVLPLVIYLAVSLALKDHTTDQFCAYPSATQMDIIVDAGRKSFCSGQNRRHSKRCIFLVTEGSSLSIGLY